MKARMEVTARDSLAATSTASFKTAEALTSTSS